MLHDLQHPPLIQIGEHSPIMLATAKTLFIESHPADLLRVTSLQPAAYRRGLNPMYLMPVQPEMPGGGTLALRDQQQTHRRRFELHGES